MAFVNVYLTEEQREEFERKCIGNPLSPALPVLKPLEWICDNEKELYLFSIGTHHDYPNEELFFLALEKSRVYSASKEKKYSS